MREYESLPRARKDGLLVEDLGEELLLYDENSHVGHCLNPIAARIWRHCDGERDVSELAALAGVSESFAADALHELRGKDLLAAESQLMQGAVSSISRREAIGRGVRYGAAATVGSLIVSATAATPAMASSEEKPKKCEEKVGENRSCCLCIDGFCITSGGVIEERTCRIECETHGGIKTFVREGKCV